MRKGSKKSDLVHGFGINDIHRDSKLDSDYYRCYGIWVGFLRRCYSNNRSLKNISYTNTVVCDEWKYYSNFKIWYYNNYIEGYQIDKDVIGGTLDIYSPETCAFIPNLINSCIIDGNRKDKSTPIGVSLSIYKNNVKYRTCITKYGKQLKNFGLYDNPYDAHKIWQIEKRNYLLELIDKYSNDVVPEVIQGLQRRVDILNNDILNGIETKTISKV
ncbi:DNA binding protein [Klebsiella phage Muenster]|nr:DNA binding protein [Klebsiella phage Muenster]